MQGGTAVAYACIILKISRGKAAGYAAYAYFEKM